MVKMNMEKIEDTTKQLKDENDLIKRQYRSVTCCTYSIPAMHKHAWVVTPITSKVSFAICVQTRSKN